MQGKRMLQNKIFIFIAATCVSAISHSLYANGFILPEQNASNLGMAYAGTASLAEDASINFYNAAGLTRLCNEQLVAGGVLALPYTRLDVTRATAPTGAPLIPSSGHTRPDNNAMIPFMHYALRLSDNMVAGLSLVSNWGSKTNYDDSSIARYIATRSKLITADISPSLAYSFCNGLSLGAGFDAVYAEARLANRLGIGIIDTDGYSEIRGYDWAFGWHAGLLYEFDNCTRVGLNYRSRVKESIHGQAYQQVLAGFPVTMQGARANLTLPDTATASVYYALNDCWAFMADAQWIHWKLYDRLIIRLDDGTNLTTNNYWHNSYRLAIGGSYQFTDCLRLRAGTSYDKTPQRDAHRPIFNPDGDQVGLGLGAQYRFSPCLALDLGYVHVFQKSVTIHQGTPAITGGPTLPFTPDANLQGTMKNRIDVFGMQLTWDLG